MSEFVFIMTCWLSGERSLPFGLLVSFSDIMVILFSDEQKCHMSRVMRKPDFFICENKAADQRRGNRKANQCLCFRYIASTLPLLPKSEISSLYTYTVAVQPDLYRTWLETPKTGFLATRLMHVYAF